MKVRKFSDYFALNIKSLKYTGIWFNPKTLRKTSLFIAAYILTVNALCIYMPQICHVIYMYKARNNVKAFADEFYVSLSSLMVVFKDLSLMRNFEKIQELLADVDSDMFKPNSEKQKNIICRVCIMH